MKPLFLASYFATSLLMIPASAAASLPMVDGVGSYTHSQVMKHRSDSGKKATPSRAAKSRAYRRSLMDGYVDPVRLDDPDTLNDGTRIRVGSLP